VHSGDERTPISGKAAREFCRVRNVLVGDIVKSGGRIDGRGAIIAPSADFAKAGGRVAHTAAKSIIRSRALAGDDDVSPRESRELDEAGARKTTGHVRVWVGDAHADHANAGFVHRERWKGHTVPVGRHDIALRNNIRRKRAGARQCRLEDEPGEHVASETVAVLGT